MTRDAFRNLLIIGFIAVGLLATVWIAVAVDDDAVAGEPRHAASSRRAAIDHARRAPALPAPSEPARVASSTPDVVTTSSDPRHHLARALDSDAPISPDETIARIDRGLAETGASSEPWTRDAGDAFAALDREIPVAVSDLRCYAAGCVVTVTYPPGTDATSVAQTIVRSPAIAAWPGGKLASPTAVVGADHVGRWVLLRPDAL